MDDKLKRLLQEEMKADAERIMEKVNSDPSLKDVEAPEIIRERLFQQIREYEESKAQNHLSEEDKELIRLGKKYKKTKKRGKYLILIAAIVGALGIGVTSFGGPKRVWKEVEGMLAGKEQTYTDTGDDRMEGTPTVSEVEAYQKVEEKFGFVPVKLYYLPSGMMFIEMRLSTEIQNVQFNYEDGNHGVIKYRMIPNNRTGSVGADVEDELVEEYDKIVKATTVHVKKYLRGESKEEKWNIKFEYQDVQYTLLINGVSEQEVEKIIENLHFSS